MIKAPVIIIQAKLNLACIINYKFFYSAKLKNNPYLFFFISLILVSVFSKGWALGKYRYILDIFILVSVKISDRVEKLHYKIKGKVFYTKISITDYR
jgi:hypothetical protein